MPITELRGAQIKDSSVQRVDLDIVTTGQAVIRRIIAGTNITIGSTGVDTGTGDVTINADGNMILASAQNITGEKTFDSTMLALFNPAKTFKYNVVTSAIAAQRNITLPLLGAADVFVFEAFAQTLTNKTINLTSNTLSGTKAQFNTAVSDGDIVFLDSVDTITGVKTMSGLNVIKVAQAGLTLRNPANTFDYTIQTAAIAAARTITLPLLTGNDTMVTEAHTQTLTNKTITTIIGVAGTANNLWTATTTGNSLILTGQTSGTITLGGTGATGAITIGQATTAQTLNLATGATANATTKTVNIGTTGVAGSTTDVNIGSAVASAVLGTLSLNFPTILTAANNLTVSLWNTLSTTINFAGAATTFNMGSTPTASTTINLFNNPVAASNTKVVNIANGGAASSVTSIGIGISSSGTVSITMGSGTGSIVYFPTDVRLTSAVVTSATFSTSHLLIREVTTNRIEKVAASGGGTTNFLRADGTWAAPAGGGSPAGATNELQKNSAGAFAGTKLFSTADGNFEVGDSGLAGSVRDITTQGSATNIDLRLAGKGSGTIIANSDFVARGTAIVGQATLSATHSLTVITGAGATSIGRPIKLQHEDTDNSAFATGGGSGLTFSLETSSNNYEEGAYIDAISTNVGAGTEAFDLVFKTMAAGATAATRLTLNSTVLSTASGIKIQENGVNISPIGKHDIWIPASAMWPRVTSGCTALTKAELATSLVNVQYLEFQGVTANQYAQFIVQMPRNWSAGTSVTFRAHWYGTAGSGTVEWELSAGAYSDDDALTVALGTSQNSIDTFIVANDNHISPRSSAITIAGSPNDEDLIVFQIMRDQTNDTNASPARLLGITLEITTDTAVAA